MVDAQTQSDLEGQELLRLYEGRNNSLESSRKLQQAESQLSALQIASTNCSNQLAQLEMSVTNMYSIARHYQPSLPQLHMIPSTKDDGKAKKFKDKSLKSNLKPEKKLRDLNRTSQLLKYNQSSFSPQVNVNTLYFIKASSEKYSANFVILPL